MTEHPVSVRLDDDAIRRLERIAEALSERAGGALIKRGTAVRVAVQHGIEALETELGLVKKKR